MEGFVCLSASCGSCGNIPFSFLLEFFALQRWLIWIIQNDAENLKNG